MLIDPIPIKPNYNLLYHYTTWEIATSYILPNEELRMCPFEQTNDPRENKKWTFTLAEDKKLDEGHEIIKNFPRYQEHFSNILKSEVKLICFTQDVKSSGVFKPRMWTQYADKNTGVCLVFNKEKLIKQFDTSSKNSEIKKHCSVSYDRKMFSSSFQNNAFTFYSSEILNLGFEEACKNKINDFWKVYYFSKEIDWKTENEYRFMCFFDDKEYLFIPILDSIEGIILGVNFDRKKKKLLNMILKSFQKPLEVLQLEFLNNNYILFPYNES